jgi:hypothetical protein
MSVIIELLIGILIADFITGIFHWFEDQYLNDDCFLCRKFSFIKSISDDNNIHHKDPQDITKYNMLENTKNSFIIALPVILILFLMDILFNITTTTSVLFMIFTNHLHSLSHMPPKKLSKFTIFLQKTWIICNPINHHKHHVTTNSNYCVTSRILNIVLDGINFWRILEKIIFVTTGTQPNYR